MSEKYFHPVALPLKTTADDVLGIVKYLKTKPTGATSAEAKAVAKKAADPRKLAAYVAWGVVTRDGDRLKLAPRGSTLARDPDRAPQIFLEIIGSMAAYRSVTELAYQQNMGTLDTNDVASHWHEYHTEAVGEANDNTLRENAVCFFNIAVAAGLGSMIIGRGGKATRLDLDKGSVAAFIEAGPTTPPWTETADADEAEAEVEAVEQAGEQPREQPPAADEDAPSVNGGSKPAEELRVFLAHGSNDAIVQQIEEMCDVASIKVEIAEEEETSAIPVPEKVLTAMRRCNGGIIAVTVDEGRKDEEGNYTLNENVLIEIGAAFVLYDRRVVLVWDKRLPVPSNLQGLYRCEFEGNELLWADGMKLMKAIQGFKKPQDA